jgi:hypothetical protein
MMVSVKGELLVREVEMACSVIGKTPAVAIAVALNVTWLVPLVAIGVAATVTPAGRPEADRLTVPVKPPRATTVAVPDAVNPRGSARLVGRNETVNEGFVTVRLTVSVALRVAETPLTVMGYTPARAVAFAAKVSVLAVEVLAGLKVAVTPLGRPAALSAMSALKPFWPTTPIEVETFAELATVGAATELVRLKIGARTVSATGTAVLRVPETPLMERV